jgi:hypothetical protein
MKEYTYLGMKEKKKKENHYFLFIVLHILGFEKALDRTNYFL